MGNQISDVGRSSTSRQLFLELASARRVSARASIQLFQVADVANRRASICRMAIVVDESPR